MELASLSLINLVWVLVNSLKSQLKRSEFKTIYGLYDICVKLKRI